MEFWTLALVATSLAQEPALEFVNEELPDGRRLEYLARVEADGSRTRHGEFALWSADGKKLVLGEYADGEKSGRWNYRFDDGKPWVTGAYREGERSGTWTFRHANREKRAQGRYLDGQLDGEWEFWDESGRLDAAGSGTLEPLVADYLGGAAEYRGTTLDGVLHGRWTSWWENGQKRLEAEFDRGRRAGRWSFWHSDGTYDPDFLSGRHELGRFFPELEVEPVPVPESVEQVSIAAAVAGGARSMPEPNRLQPITEGAGMLGDLRSYRGGNAEARDALLARGREALPDVIEGLRTLDYGEADQLAFAQRALFEVVGPILYGHVLVVLEEPPNAAAVRLAVARAHSLYFLTKDANLWWTLDLELGSHVDGMTVCEHLLDPPSVPEVLYGASSTTTGVFGQRFGKRDHMRTVGGSGTEEPLAAALAWLARNQRDDGGWSSGDDLHDLGVTGLALLAFAGDGHTLQGGLYRGNVTRGLSWLLDHQDPDSGRFLMMIDGVDPETGKRTRLYSSQFLFDHAIATQAVCELAHLGGSRGLRAAAQRAVNYITISRNPYGVWRYSNPPDGDNDTAVTGWMIQALAAADRAGVQVDRQSWPSAITWFDEVTDNSSGRVGYTAIGEPSCRYSATNEHYPREATEAMTAVGLWCRFLLGQDPAEHKIMRKHADLMLKTLPEWDDDDGLTNDLFYWYHGAHAMRRMGGNHWKSWNKSMKLALVDSQEQAAADAGSWEPNGTWGMFGGRAYTTAMAALCLEVYFRFDEGQGEE